jgi:GNAT superfamily N-acetyltransferase
MPFLIRQAIAADVPAIAHVHVASWRSTYQCLVPDEFLAQLDEASRAEQWHSALGQEVVLLVAEHQGQVVGFACAGAAREPQGPCTGELYAIYLLQSAQRGGLGSALVQAVAQRLLARRLGGMLVWVLEANPATGFYRRLGGQLLGSKDIQIGEATLRELSFGWPLLEDLASPPAPLYTQP